MFHAGGVGHEINGMHISAVGFCALLFVKWLIINMLDNYMQILENRIGGGGVPCSAPQELPEELNLLQALLLLCA